MSEIVFLQHHPLGVPGYLMTLCRRNGIFYDVAPLYAMKSIAGKVDSSHLCILGGDVELHDMGRARRAYPYLDSELDLIREYIDTGRPVLAICLGAELVARAMGLEVRKSGREYGWVKMNVLDPEYLMLEPDTRRATMFAYHDDSFTPPAEARLIMVSPKVQNEAFIMDKLIATQFHPEVTTDMVHVWTSGDAQIMKQTGRYIDGSHEICDALFERFMVMN